MSILSDAWRRARGEEHAITRALGAPPLQPGARRGHWLPWVLSCLLLIVVVGLSVYLWRTHRQAHPTAQSGRTAVVTSPVRPTAAPAQAGGIKSSSGAKASHAAAATARVPTDASAAPVQAVPSALATARTTGAAAVSGTAPEAVRARLPALAVTVHVWNPNPASRFIMVNGRVYHEGDELSPGLSLVSITPGGEVVKFKGYLITLGNR